jgi:hypothetical protein
VGDVDFLEVKLLMAVVVVSMLVSCEWVIELEFDRYLGLGHIVLRFSVSWESIGVVGVEKGSGIWYPRELVKLRGIIIPFFFILNPKCLVTAEFWNRRGMISLTQKVWESTQLWWSPKEFHLT